jgi:hypothetical protein
VEIIDVMPSEDVAQADWIGPRLHPFRNYDAGSVIPTGFEAYARLDHERTGVLPAEVAEALVRVLCRHTSTSDELWMALWEGYGYVHGPGPSFVAFTAVGPEPRPEDPPLQRFAMRYPPFRRRGGPRIQLPGRDYVLYRGAPERAAGWMDGPNLWWPDDHAWCVASEIDLTWTYVGGTTALVDELISDAEMAAKPASIRDSNLASEQGR